MSLQAKYQQQIQRDWTRIELLLALLDKAIEHVAAARKAYGSNDHLTATNARLKAAAVVTAVQSGLNTDYGEIPKNLAQLYDHVLYCISRDTPDYLDSAIRVMQTVREAFEGIRPEAERLERTGEIPPLNAQPSLDTFA